MVEMFERSWPLLEPAADQWGEHTKESVLRALNSGAKLWVGERSAAVTEIVNRPRLRIANAWLAGGDLDELREWETAMVAWAKLHGCHQARIYGRRGFLRALPDFHEIGTVMGRDL